MNKVISREDRQPKQTMDNYNCIKKCEEIIHVDKKDNNENKLFEFRNVLIWICQKLYSENIPICLKYGNEFKNEGSCVSLNTTTGKKTVWLNMSTTSGKDLLWILIHEYGHVLLGTAPDEKIRTKSWEKDAWDTGWRSVVSEFPDLKRHSESFMKKRDKAILSYREEPANRS